LTLLLDKTEVKLSTEGLGKDGFRCAMEVNGSLQVQFESNLFTYDAAAIKLAAETNACCDLFSKKSVNQQVVAGPLICKTGSDDFLFESKLFAQTLGLYMLTADENDFTIALKQQPDDELAKYASELSEHLAPLVKKRQKLDDPCFSYFEHKY
jgi:hypothetical protein